MSCIITYKGSKYTQEQFKEYISNNKNEFSHIIASNKNVIDSFKRKMEGIDFVFSQSPELASIGSKAQYLQYLSTIFKTSKVKDIVYHGNKKTLNKQFLFVTKTKSYAERYDEKQEGVNYLLINVQNIKDADAMFADKITALTYSNDKEKQQQLKKQGFDSINSYKEIVVFEPEQIHILGSKQDIEGFKKFVNKPTFDKELAQKIQAKLQKLYPEIKLNITNNPVWEQGDNIFNQEEYNNQVNYRLKATKTVLDNLAKIKQWESNKSIDQNTLWKKIGELGIPKQQLDLLKESEGNTIEEKLVNFIASYSYAIKINIATEGYGEPEVEPQLIDPDTGDIIVEGRIIYNDGSNSRYYDYLTVPGGTNYTENEISTPLITPAIKGHAQFSTDKGIGWFRSDEQVIGKKDFSKVIEDEDGGISFEFDPNIVTKGILTKIRRILEVQSDLFQKGRDNKYLSKELSDRIDYLENYRTTEEETNELEELKNKSFPGNTFLQLLNKDNNWVTFFIKSIIQDSAKKGYEKVLFPTKDTIIPIESAGQFKNYKEAELHYKTNEWKQKDNELREQLKKAQEEKDNNKALKIKQQIKDHQPDLLGTANTYENIGNILEKQFGKDNVKTITDEYGNQWREITINQARDLANILLQRDEANRIIGQANIKAMTVLVDAINQKQDTLPHEYAHHYIAWFRDTPIVQEAIKKWGSEEALVQSIGEQVVKQKGEAYNWWNKFIEWIMNQFNSLSKLQKEELTQILTDAFLTRQNLGSKQDIEGLKTFIKERSSVDLTQSKDLQSIVFKENETLGYRERTVKNASADATIAIAIDFNTAGERLTKNSVLNQNKKYIPIDANSLEVTKEIVNKIVEQLNSIPYSLFGISLNIAGNGIYTLKHKYTQSQIDEFTYILLRSIINSPNLKTQISSIRTGGQTGFDEAGAKAGIKLGIPTTILAPKGWVFRNTEGRDISNEQAFKERFKVLPVIENTVNNNPTPIVENLQSISDNINNLNITDATVQPLVGNSIITSNVTLISVKQQLEFVDYLTNKIASDLILQLKDNSKLRFSSDYLREQLNTYKNIFEQASSLIQTNTLKKQHIQEYLNNWNNVEQAVLNRLKLISGLRVKQNESLIEEDLADDNEEFSTEESLIVKSNYDDGFFLTLDYNNIASTEMRLALYGLTNKNKNFYLTPNDPTSALPIGIETVLNTVHSITADLPGDYNKMKEAMVANFKKYPWLEDLIARLDNNETLKNEFVRNMHKYTVNMKKIIDKGNGEYSLFNSNSNSVYFVNLQEWNDLLLESKLVRENKEGKYEFNTNSVKGFANFLGIKITPNRITVQLDGLLNKMVNDETITTNEKKAFLDKFLDYFNIYLTNDLVEDIINDKYSITPTSSAPATFGSLFSGSNSLFGKLIYNVLEGRELDNLYSGNLMKNLIVQNSEITSSSSWSRNKTISGYSYPMYLTEETNALFEKNDNGELVNVKALANLPFSQNNYLIEGLLSGHRAYLESFEYFHLDLSPIEIKGSKDSFSEFQNLSPISQYKTKLTAFWNNGTTIDGQRVALMFYPTMSDKKVPVLFTIPIRDIPSSPIQLANMLYDSLVSPEVSRMKAWREALENSTEQGELIPNLEWFNEGANIFYRIPELNDLSIDYNGEKLDLLIDFPETLTDYNGISLKKKLDNADKGLSNRIKKIINPVLFEDGSDKQIVLQQAIKNKITEVVDREINNQINQWKSDGLKIKDIPAEYLQYINKKYEITSQDIEGQWFNIAKDFVLNGMMVNANLEALYISDTADYFDKSAYKEISKENINWTNVIKKTEANRAKRLSGDKAVRYYGDYTVKPTVNVLYAQDVKALPAALDYYKELGFSDSFIDDNLKANTTDGFALCSIDEHLENLVLAGTISNQERTSILKQYYSGKPLSIDTLNIVLNPLKPVFNGKQLVSNAPWKEHKIFIKYAQVPLLRQFTEGGNLYLDNLRKLVENSQQNTDRSKQIDIIAFASTTKVGLPLKGNQVNVLNNSLYQTKDYESNIIPLNRRNFGIQLDKPFDEFKHKITIGTQETSTLFSRIRKINGFKYKGKTYTGRELEKVYENVYKNIYQKQYNKLVEDLFNEDKTQIDINKLSNLIYKEGVARGYSINTLLGLNINKDSNNFDVPLWANPESSKIEALLMAIIKNRVIKLKTTGKGFILQSDIGVWEDKTTEEKSDIVSSMIFTSQWDGNKLKGRHIDPETGEVLGAQILIRSVFEDSFGRTYDIYDYIDKIGTKTTSGRYVVDLNKLSQVIPKSILEGFGFRIPTQDYSSMSLVEIIGFLPKTHGDAIIAPSDFVSQMGLDFDIDVLYTYLYKTASIFDNELGIPVLKRLDELTESDINSIVRTAIQAKKSNSLAESTLNLFDAALKQEDLKEKLKEEVEEAKLYNELLDIHIAVSKFVGENGKDMSVQNMFSKLLDYGGLEDGSNKEIAAKFQEVRDNKLGLNTFNYLTPQHQGDSYNRANAAKGAVGAFATIKGLFNDIVDKFETPLQFVSNKDGENQFYLKIDNFETIGYIAANFSKESPLDIINNFLSTAVDDEKLRVLPRLNINDYTIPTIVGLAGLGFNLNQILNVINQDVIFTAIKILKQKQATGNINPRDPFTIFNVLKEAGYFKDYESLEDLNIQYFDLTTEDLEKSKSLTEGELYKKVQAKTLYTFLQGLKVGNQLFYIRSNTNMNSKGLPASIIDTAKLADNIEYLKRDEVGKDSEKIINTSQLYDGTLAGYLYNYAVLPAKKWFNDYYPYNSSIVNKTLQNLAFSITGNPTNLTEALQEFPSLYERAFKHIKAYINSSKDVLGYTNLDIIRKDLITDNKKEVARTIKEPITGLTIETSDVYFASENGKLQLSLSTILNNLKKTPYYKNNLFLRALIVRTVKNTALISTNNTTGRKIDPNELFIEFSKLLTDNQNITFKVEAADENNNISMVEYTINSKELGIKLIQYSFLLNNTLKAKNFEKYLPTSLLKELGIFKGMQEFNWNNYIDINNISTQLIQHNTDLVKSILSIENLKDITSGINNENSLFTTVSTIKNGTKEMIYSFEPNINNFRYFYSSPNGEIIFNPYILIKQDKESYLYKYDAGQNKYIFLPPLGNLFLTEYNPNSIGNITSSVFNINNPDFNGDITTYKATQNVILTQDKKDRQTNLSSALDELLQSPALEEYKTIASVISKIPDVSNIPVTFKSVVVNSMGQNVFGLYKNGNIYVNNTLDKELLQDTLLHEAVHGTISNIILNPKTTEQQLLKQRLFNVHDLFVDNLSIDLLKKHFKGISEDKLLTLKSVFKKGDIVSLDEFIAYSLSSKNFREVLKDQGLWEKVYLLLKNILKTVGITIKDDVSLNQNLLSLTEKYIFASLDEYMSTVKTTNEPFVKQAKAQQNETTDLFRLAIENKSTNQIFLQALGLDSFEDLSEEEHQLILNELIKKDPTKNTSEFLGELKNKLCKHG